MRALDSVVEDVAAVDVDPVDRAARLAEKPREACRLVAVRCAGPGSAEDGHSSVNIRGVDQIGAAPRHEQLDSRFVLKVGEEVE